LKEEFIRYNNACIDAFLKKDMNPFFRNLKKLSVWAYEHFRPMIPENLFNVWKKVSIQTLITLNFAEVGRRLYPWFCKRLCKSGRDVGGIPQRSDLQILV
jgi:hypothetical protein